MKDCTSTTEPFRACQQHPARACQQQDMFMIMTPGGVQTGVAGDYLVEDARGVRLAIPRFVFEQTYRFTAPEVAAAGGVPNQFWNGQAWVSGIVAPVPPPELPKPLGMPAGSYYPPAVRLEPHELPGSPQHTLQPALQMSPPNLTVPQVPTMNPYAAQAAWAAREAANTAQLQAAWQAAQPTAPTVPATYAPAGVPVMGERPLTPQEMAMVAASRAAPNGAVMIPAAPVQPDPAQVEAARQNLVAQQQAALALAQQQEQAQAKAETAKQGGI